jgi:uncharacterized peroxidase-related enzyme
MRKVFGRSPKDNLGQGYMDLSGTLQGGTLDRQMQESIAVAVSDFNGCTYCLSVHSGLAEQEGLSEDERERAQQFESEVPKRAAALHFVQEVVESRGHPSEKAFDGVREAGYTDEQIMEMIANVALNTFSNYMNETVEIDVDVLSSSPRTAGKRTCVGRLAAAPFVIENAPRRI